MVTKHANATISSILDIGCSTGLFLNVCKEILPESLTYGVEPNLSERKIAEQHGISILGSDVSEIQGRTFDVITLWDVLEHIKRPMAYLKYIRAYMNSSSLLFLQIPSCDSISARILQEHCNMFDGIEHLSLFGLKGISTLLSKAGFSVLDLTTVITDSFAMNNYLSYDHPYLPTSTTNTASSLMPECFPPEKQLLDSGLGYKIQLVAKIS